MKYAKLAPEAKAPVRKNPTDAGIDVFSLNTVEINPHDLTIVRTGLTFEIPEGYALQVWPKSRNNHLIGAGILDAGYQGEVLVKVVNYSPDELFILAGDPVAQLVLVKIGTPILEETSAQEIHLRPSDRGATGGIVEQAS